MEKVAITAFFRKGFARAARKKPVVPLSFRKGVNTDPVMTFRGYKQQAQDRGIDSFTAAIPLWAAEKMFGKEKVRNAVWNAVSKPALIADTATGNMLRKIPGSDKLSTTSEKIPWGNREGFYRKVQRSSALAPLVKARQFVAPIIVGVGLEKGINKAVSYAKEPQMPKSAQDARLIDKDLREKVASVMLQLHSKNKEHEKRAKALRLLYKQAEMGLVEVPRSYNELEEKLGSLVNQDLEVFEKALELTGGQTMLGELGTTVDPAVRGASEQFQAAIIGHELI